MFWVIVLHKAMAVRVDAIDKWDEGCIKDGRVEWGIHYSFKYTDSCSSPQANSSPDMYLSWMFWSVGGDTNVWS